MRVLQMLKVDDRVDTTKYQAFHEGDSGLDLYTVGDVLIPAGQTGKLEFGIAAALVDEAAMLVEQQHNLPIFGSGPNMLKSEVVPNFSFWLLPRSSIVKTPLRMSNSLGLIDAGYRGSLIAYVDNRSTADYLVPEGTRLFQIAAGDLTPFKFTFVKELSNTTRGTGGFGSTS